MSTPSPHAEQAAAPTAADYYAVNRGGGLFSEAVSQRAGARISVLAHRYKLSPTVLTVANLGVGCLVSFAVTVLVVRARWYVARAESSRPAPITCPTRGRIGGIWSIPATSPLAIEGIAPSSTTK